eukprot:CAMPEP_0195069312 /NCGR_PEP_ID=MMETSP0448-20130528/13634_1 /TAXON_ID=66468 /ORGANISM="Heterocapsa triquestra, Strain CCMP 448" /LENGTH=146 /DNA_ID=CAMNT_0040100883 /DNA_START=73 /DNA_END=511 /DNA_ORIENTATION=-
MKASSNAALLAANQLADQLRRVMAISGCRRGRAVDQFPQLRIPLLHLAWFKPDPSFVVAGLAAAKQSRGDLVAVRSPLDLDAWLRADEARVHELLGRRKIFFLHECIIAPDRGLLRGIRVQPGSCQQEAGRREFQEHHRETARLWL